MHDIGAARTAKQINDQLTGQIGDTLKCYELFKWCPYRGENMNKYHAIRTYSELCGREFASRHEAQKAEELKMLEMAGEISGLQYQIPFILCRKPKVSVTIDFMYNYEGKIFYADAKGVLTRDSRTKYAWLEQSTGIHVELI
jgi:hypothetical protein